MPTKKSRKTFSDDEDLSSEDSDAVVDKNEEDSEDELLIIPRKRKSNPRSASKLKKLKSDLSDVDYTSTSQKLSGRKRKVSLKECNDDDDENLESGSDYEGDSSNEEKSKKKTIRNSRNSLSRKSNTGSQIKSKKDSNRKENSENSEDDSEKDSNISDYNDDEDKDADEMEEEEEEEEDSDNSDDENFEERTSKQKKEKKQNKRKTITTVTKSKSSNNKKGDVSDDDDDDEILSINKSSNNNNKKNGSNSSVGGYLKEQIKYKSSAEFFAENQNIAGFDNAGKALYTSIREMVENSLDATESIQILPDISIKMYLYYIYLLFFYTLYIYTYSEELTTDQFNELRGIKTLTRNDESLYQFSSTSSTNNSNKDNNNIEDKKNNNNSNSNSSRTSTYYYRLTVKDNGIGMEHNKIADMFGRVLSGSKYGVRQCRGKFGLGAKMALIWSKKSTGLPISIKTGYSDKPKQFPLKISNVVLDINIHTNEPNILKYIFLYSFIFKLFFFFFLIVFI